MPPIKTKSETCAFWLFFILKKFISVDIKNRNPKDCSLGFRNFYAAAIAATMDGISAAFGAALYAPTTPATPAFDNESFS